MAKTTLISIPYSPWSEMARWALDHHRIAYEKEPYLSIVQAPMIRIRRRRWRGKVTVPMLFAPDRILTDSLDIARYADEVGGGAPLFPAGRADEVVAWNALAQGMLAAGRIRTTDRVSADPAAMLESLPPPIKGLPEGLGLHVAKFGARYLHGKYGELAGEGEATLGAGLARLREGLGGGEHLMGGFSYADVVMAISLQFVSPVADEYIRLGRVSRPLWGEPALAEEYADLVAWRDRIYAGWRRPEG